MTESDDFLTGGGVDIPKQTAANPKQTAEALPQDSEAARKNRKRAAGTLTAGFAKPTLGTPGLNAANKANVLGLTI
jgi:hypothetical protein